MRLTGPALIHSPGGTKSRTIDRVKACFSRFARCHHHPERLNAAPNHVIQGFDPESSLGFEGWMLAFASMTVVVRTTRVLTSKIAVAGNQGDKSLPSWVAVPNLVWGGNPHEKNHPQRGFEGATRRQTRRHTVVNVETCLRQSYGPGVSTYLTHKDGFPPARE